ncbi:hypothetical protein AGOR_G00223420 [Albula goreensis]|uniref:Uncharacterized protein n=1 Tax=Albula goreensis TaxID=1534307 RepID=A0A8T3CLX6_9TELE|nr:hypothetical protein AGOR_G00223420 [Albula goreensis]
MDIYSIKWPCLGDGPARTGGSSTDSDCAFEGDYTVPPLPVTEGMQHIRIMEGVSRSLPSSPLLTHQAISMRLQPMKRLTGKAAIPSPHPGLRPSSPAWPHPPLRWIFHLHGREPRSKRFTERSVSGPN